MPIASDRINRLAAINGAQRYLEIGVAEGYTFMDVKIAHKTGIDPNFLFDYTKYSDLPGHHFFKTTSDDFLKIWKTSSAMYMGKTISHGTSSLSTACIHTDRPCGTSPIP